MFCLCSFLIRPQGPHAPVRGSSLHTAAAKNEKDMHGRDMATFLQKIGKVRETQTHVVHKPLGFVKPGVARYCNTT
jgi:hypothetical protein